MSEYSTACTCPTCTTCTYDCLLRVGSSDSKSCIVRTRLVAGVEAQAPTASILATDDSYVRGVRDAVSRQESV
jgi:hypothetical protein